MSNYYSRFVRRDHLTWKELILICAIGVLVAWML